MSLNSRGFVPLIAAVAIAMPAVARAQAQQGADAAAFDAKAATHIKKEYLADLDTLHSKIVALANAIPADKYSWRPGAGVRSVSEVLMHVVGEWYHWAPSSVGGKAPADFPAARQELMAKLQGLEKITTKPEVIAELNKSWTHCKTQIANADASKLTGKYEPWKTTLDAAALGMAGDLHEHLGQLIAYGRSVGVKPPWSK
ncbi:MAG TPA: DinB family protein [Gemmatimonadaceae bacterium]